MAHDSVRGGGPALFVVASALIVVPLVAGALFFFVTAPAMRPGVYIEVARGNIIDVFPLGGTSTGAEPAAAAANAVVLPEGELRAFLVVETPGVASVRTAASMALYTFAVDTADPRLTTERIPLPSEIRRVNHRIVRISSEELGAGWDARHLAFQHYRRVLAQTTSPRASLEAFVGLELQDTATSQRRVYSVRVGPQVALEGR